MCNIMTSPPSSPQPNPSSQLTRSLVILPSQQRRSLIDNTLAQACSLKRSQRQLSSTTAQVAALLKKSKSDSSMTVKRSTSNSKFTYKNHRTVKIASTGCVPPSSYRQQQQSCTSNSSSSLTTVSSSSSSECTNMANAVFKTVSDVCPYTFIKSIIDTNDETDNQQQCSTSKIIMQPLHEDEFLPPTEEQVAAYTNEAVSAVRSSDISALRQIYNQYGSLAMQCCNRYGESLLHVACRRSTPSIVSFLLNEANVSPRIKDDYGRTPLHDACWRGTPQYEIVEMLLSQEPRLLYCQDVRGHLPMQYARREHWSMWCNFLDEKRHLIF